jgi:hypothetical protein
MRSPVLGVAVVATAMIAGCGPNTNVTPTSPTPATTQSPFITQFGGFWNGSLTLTRVSGGECVGQDYAATIGSVDVGTVVISQTQTDVTAIIRSATTGLNCRYQGSAGPGAFALSTQKCEGISETLFQCANGASRILEQIGSTVTATRSGDTANGTVTTWFNVFAESTEEDQRKPVAGMVLEEQFTAVRR